MRRMILFSALLLLTTLCLQASYKIYLVSGQVVTADAKPEIREGMAYFSKAGLHCYMPTDKIDLVKTENPNAVKEKPGNVQKSSGSATAVRTISDEKLNDAIKNSKLANEGELSPPPYEETAPTAGGTGGEAAAPGSAQTSGGGAPQVKDVQKARQEVMIRLKEASDELNRATQERDALIARQRNLRDQYDLSIQQADKDRLDSEMQSVNGQIASSAARVSDIKTRVTNIQEVLNSMPIVVEAGGGQEKK